jgi:hypothetical protein
MYSYIINQDTFTYPSMLLNFPTVQDIVYTEGEHLFDFQKSFNLLEDFYQFSSSAHKFSSLTNCSHEQLRQEYKNCIDFFSHHSVIKLNLTFQFELLAHYHFIQSDQPKLFCILLNYHINNFSNYHQFEEIQEYLEHFVLYCCIHDHTNLLKMLIEQYIFKYNIKIHENVFNKCVQYGHLHCFQLLISMISVESHYIYQSFATAIEYQKESFLSYLSQTFSSTHQEQFDFLVKYFQDKTTSEQEEDNTDVLF